MNKRKILSWALFFGGFVGLVAWMILRFRFGRSDIPVSPAALALVGVSLSMDYQGEKFRKALLALQIFAGAVIAATAVNWALKVHPAWYSTALNVASIAVSVPLAALGLKRGDAAKKETPQKEEPKETPAEAPEESTEE